MSIVKTSLKKSYIPFLLRKSKESYQKLGEEEIAGFAIYFSENERKKPGILRRKGERIKNIVLVFYPIFLGAYSNGSAVLIDPLKRSKFTVSFNALDEEVVDAALSELASSSGKSFLDVMIKIDRLTEEISSGKKNVFKRTVELEDVVSDSSFVNDLKVFLNHTTTYSLPSIELPWVNVSCEEVLGRIRQVMIEINNLINYVSKVLEKVNEFVSSWKKSIQKEYEDKIVALDHKIKETREVVLSKIDELKKKKEEELTSVRERYRPHIEAVEKRIIETQENIKRLEEEIERAKSYGKDTSDLKKRLDELKKTLETLERELKEEKTKYESEVERVEKKFTGLVEAENNKIKSLLQEKEALQREFESITQEADRRSDKIRGSLQEYRESLIKVEKEIERISLSVPSGGEGLYMIPIIYTSYISEGSLRSIITTPVILEPGGWLSSKLTPVVVDGLSKYLSWSKDLIEKEERKPELEAKNLLTNLSLERIEFCLMKLSEIGLLSRDEVKELVSSIEEQKKMT